MLDLNDIADVIADAVKDATAPLIARIDALEQREAGVTETRALALVGEKGAEIISLSERVAELEVKLPTAEPLTVEQVRSIVDEKASDIAPLVDRIAALEVREVPSIDGLIDKAAVEAVISPFVERIAELEHRAPVPGPRGEVNMVEVDRLLADKVDRAISAIPVPKDGIGMAGGFINKDGVLVITRTDGTTIETSVVVGKDGDSVNLSDLHERLDKLTGELVARAVADIPPPTPLTADDMRPVVERTVADAVAALPVPKDGKSVTVEDVAPMIAAEVEKAVSAIPVPENGKSIDPDEVRGMIVDEVAKIPRPRDGLGLENLHVEQEGRNINLILRAGEEEAKFSLYFPVPAYKGVYRPEQAYEAGDMVTYAGSVWHCDQDSKRAPNVAHGEWTLCVKQGDRGRPGKDAKDEGL